MANLIEFGHFSSVQIASCQQVVAKKAFPTVPLLRLIAALSIYRYDAGTRRTDAVFRHGKRTHYFLTTCNGIFVF